MGMSELMPSLRPPEADCERSNPKVDTRAIACLPKRQRRQASEIAITQGYSSLAMTLFIFCFLSWNSVSAQLSLPQLRTLYLEAVESEDKSEQFMNYMNSINHQDALMHAYFASAQALVSKHLSGPSEKLKQLKLADKSFEEAIAKNPVDAEVRFLRFSVQHNLPRFLGYSDDMEEDLKLMLQHIPKTKSLQDYQDWRKVVIDFVLDSDECFDEQAASFKSLLK